MRSDFTPQVETREIDDTDLDGVAGGIGLEAGAGLHLTGVSDTLSAVGAAVPVGGLVNTVTGLTGLTGTVTGLTGLVSGV